MMGLDANTGGLVSEVKPPSPSGSYMTLIPHLTDLSTANLNSNPFVPRIPPMLSPTGPTFTSAAQIQE